MLLRTGRGADNTKVALRFEGNRINLSTIIRVDGGSQYYQLVILWREGAREQEEAVTLHRTASRAEVFLRNDTKRFADLRQIAAEKLLPFSFHQAGGGSEYIVLGDLKIRFADHEHESI